MSDIEFVDEPPLSGAKRKTGSMQKKIDLLQAQPGQWAKVHTASTAGAARSGAWNWKMRGCEAVSRGLDVYARWPVDSNGSAS